MQGRRLDALESTSKEAKCSRARIFEQLDAFREEMSDNRRNHQGIMGILEKQGDEAERGREEAARDRSEFRDSLAELGERIAAQGEKIALQGEKHLEAMSQLIDSNLKIVEFSKRQQSSTESQISALSRLVSVPGTAYRTVVSMGAGLILLSSIFLTTVLVPAFHTRFDAAVAAVKHALKFW